MSTSNSKAKTYRRPHWGLVVAVAVLLLAVLIVGLIVGQIWYAFWGMVAAILMFGGLLIPGLRGTEGSFYFYLLLLLIAFIILRLVFGEDPSR